MKICPNCYNETKHNHCFRCGVYCDNGRFIFKCPDCFRVAEDFPTTCNCGYDFLRGRSAWRKSILLPKPYPYYGAKGYEQVIIPTLEHFEPCGAYVEPFLGSAAMLLNLPAAIRNRFANDRNGYICNFWRAVKQDPKTVAKWISWPANETDMHARHDWLVRQRFLDKLSADPDWHDPQIAGWWAWGQVLFIGNSWCHGPNQAEPSGPPTPALMAKSSRARRIKPDLDGVTGTVRAMLHADRTSPDRGVRLKTRLAYLDVLSARLQDCRIFCKHIDSHNRQDDWLRLLCPATFVQGRGRPVAVFIDPPYADKIRADYIYGETDKYETVAQLTAMLRSWCAHRGQDPYLCPASVGTGLFSVRG